MQHIVVRSHNLMLTQDVISHWKATFPRYMSRLTFFIFPVMETTRHDTYACHFSALLYANTSKECQQCPTPTLLCTRKLLLVFSPLFSGSNWCEKRHHKRDEVLCEKGRKDQFLLPSSLQVSPSGKRTVSLLFLQHALYLAVAVSFAALRKFRPCSFRAS